MKHMIHEPDPERAPQPGVGAGSRRRRRVPGLVGELVQIWRTHLIVAFMVGLVVGTCIGVGEGISVLATQGLFGRYNELIAWAIAFDAPATMVVEMGLALVSGVMFSLIGLVPVRRHLTALQLGETVFAGVVAVGIWLESTVSPYLFARSWLGLLLLPAIAGLLLGGLVLTISMWIAEHVLFVQRLKVRYWLVLEAAVVVAAIAYGFSR